VSSHDAAETEPPRSGDAAPPHRASVTCLLAGTHGVDAPHSRCDALRQERPPMFALVVEVEIRDDHTQAFDALVADTVAAIARNEPGTIGILTHTRSDNPNVPILYRCYRGHEAFAAHEQHAHTQRLLRERDQHVARPPTVWRLRPATGAFN
jgi:quinol monooxygenase YgiN